MRTETITGYGTIEYPDAICMAFNPMLIKVSGAGYEKAVINIDIVTPTTGTYSETRYPNADNDCWADMSSYAQGFFDRDNWGDLSPTLIQATGTGMTIYYSVTLHKSGNTAARTYSSFVVWGSMINGETYNDYRERTWFTNYPFSFGLYASASSTIALCNDGSPTTTKTISAAGVWNIPLTSYAASKYITIQDNLGTLSLTTFEDKFDLTFSMKSSQQGRVVYKINLNKNCEDGVYLRWIDRHGFYSYYLFKRGDEQRKVEAKGNFIRSNMMQYDSVYGFQSGNGRQQMIERSDVQPLCVPLVDEDTWDFLFDACCSPVVDLFVGYDSNNIPQWTPVRVQAGTYTRMERDHLQDFLCNLIMPSVEYQRL